MPRTFKQYMYLSLLMLIGVCCCVQAQVKLGDGASKVDDTVQSGKQATPQGAAEDAPTNVLSDVEWQRSDAAVEKALTWLATQQEENGDFRTLERGQPGVTSLCIMAFMSHGTQDMYPTFLTQLRNYTPSDVANLTMITNVGAIFGGLVFGYYSDRMGRRRAMITSATSTRSYRG